MRLLTTTEGALKGGRDGMYCIYDAFREDAHKKSDFLSGRTTKVWVPPPLDLNGS